ncbi:MAG: hypothetical protein DRN20_02680 [Thermoplasmata archaeon]|nr:MAG: hypothetical protein DRN20_02680 [Thermoplasmata archaeon]
MSLKSFLKNKDVKDVFEQEFKKPRFKSQTELLAPPLTNHYGLVGTAFDYLLCFYIKTISHNYTICSKFLNEIQYAKDVYNRYINTGMMNRDVFKAVLLLV